MSFSESLSSPTTQTRSFLIIISRRAVHFLFTEFMTVSIQYLARYLISWYLPLLIGCINSMGKCNLSFFSLLNVRYLKRWLLVSINFVCFLNKWSRQKADLRRPVGYLTNWGVIWRTLQLEEAGTEAECGYQAWVTQWMVMSLTGIGMSGKVIIVYPTCTMVTSLENQELNSHLIPNKSIRQKRYTRVVIGTSRQMWYSDKILLVPAFPHPWGWHKGT